MKKKAFQLLWYLCFVMLWFIGTEKIVLQQASARGRELYAVELDSPPVIDGAVEKFDMAKSEGPGIISLRGEAAVFHPERWKDWKELSAWISIGWDAQNLYFTFEIRDDKVVFAKNPEQLLKNDHVEIWLDTQLDYDYEDARMNADDLQLAIGMTQNEQTIVADWSPRRKRNEVLERGVKAVSRKYAAGKYPGGYAVEVAIPLALLKINPIQDRRIGVLLDVSDTDDADNPRQDKLLSSSKERRFRDPTSFNTLIFTFNNIRLPLDQASILDKYEPGLARRIVAAIGDWHFHSQIKGTSYSVEEVYFTNTKVPDLLIDMYVQGTWWKDGVNLVFVLKKKKEHYEIIFRTKRGFKTGTEMKPIDINESDGMVELVQEDLLSAGFYIDPYESDVIIYKYIGGEMREIWRAQLERSNNPGTVRFKNKYELVRRADSDYKAIRLTLNYGLYYFQTVDPIVKQQAENIYIWNGEKYVPEGKEHTIDELRARAAPALIKALNDEDEFVREATIEELKKIGTPEAMKAVEAYEQNR